MYVPAAHGLLINRTMHLPIPSLKPPQTIPFIQSLQPILHLPIIEVLGADEVVEHLGRVDECQYGGDGRRLPGKERVSATRVDETGGKDSEDDDCHREDDGCKKGDASFVLVGFVGCGGAWEEEHLAWKLLAKCMQGKEVAVQVYLLTEKLEIVTESTSSATLERPTSINR